MAWERSFRRQLALLRAQAAGRDISRYLIATSPVDDWTQAAIQAATSCFALTDPYQAELTFEKERWSAAERFSTFATFDLDSIFWVFATDPFHEVTLRYAFPLLGPLSGTAWTTLRRVWPRWADVLIIVGAET